MPGKGKMQITGKLGDVMQESIKAAKSYVRSKSLEYGIIPPIFEKKDFHIHVPEGSNTKRWSVSRNCHGYINSFFYHRCTYKKRFSNDRRGNFNRSSLSYWRIKEKLLAAHRAGIKEVLLPKDNEKDLRDVPKKVTEDIKLTIVSNVDEVLKIALTKELKPVKWVEVEQ